MNANVALLEPETAAAPCAEKLTQINESLQARERLLTATARASRLLLEAPDVRAAIPGVLGLIGEAAHVDRVNVMETRTGPKGEPLLVLVSEWTGHGVPPHLPDATSCICDERNFSGMCAELRAGRSVVFSKSDVRGDGSVAGIEGIGTRSKAIVPIFVAGEFLGVVGFDNTRQHRDIDAAELAALETAAGVIGAALHRERSDWSTTYVANGSTPPNNAPRNSPRPTPSSAVTSSDWQARPTCTASWATCCSRRRASSTPSRAR
jgi:hypothetical protein